MALLDRLSQALVALERGPGRTVLLFIDLDDFKSINDTLGHGTGDHVLIEITRRLTRIARRGDTAARFGGDEFVLLCVARGDDDDLRVIADRVMRTICAPITDGPHGLTVSASIGAVGSSDPESDPGELLQRADMAMYGAKRAGRNRLQIYSPQLHGASGWKHGPAAELRRAIDH